MSRPYAPPRPAAAPDGGRGGGSSGGRDNALGDEVTARLRAEWAKLGEWNRGPEDIYPAGATGLGL